MAPKGRGRKKADIVEDKLEVNDAGATEEIKGNNAEKVKKALKKNVISDTLSNNVENGINGSGETEEEQASGCDVPPSEKIAPKRGRKPAKTKSKEGSAEDEEKEVKEEAKQKDLPAKRGRKAKTENGAANKVNSTKEEVHEAQDLPRSSRRKIKADFESVNSAKDEMSEPKETKSNKKALVQSKEGSVEKKMAGKEAGRKRKNAVEKAVPEMFKKGKNEKHPDIDENRQLRVALKRNQSLDEMAKQQAENEAEIAEDSKVKNVKGPIGKGKRAAKNVDEDSKPSKKPKEDTSKSKGAAKKEKEKIPDVTALNFANESKTADGKPWNLKIATWNVNGIRAWLEKNGLSYLHHEKPDIMCIQETKCSDDKLPPEVNVEGYHCYWLAGDKDGYSGVGLLSKEKPISVQYGINIEKHDNEGRVITAEYDAFYLVTTYIPNAGRGLVRLDYRQEWDKDFQDYLKMLDEKKPVILCGDLNVSHGEIDLANPKSNKKNAGFSKEEREGFSTLLSKGFVDSFRHLYPDQKGAYTFWTYMMNARAKNVGWRLDYFVISTKFIDHLCDNVIRKDVYGSDHCPIALFLHV